jgi:hypothetical protein
MRETVWLPSFSSQVEFQVPDHDGATGAGAAVVIAAAGDSAGTAAVAAGVAGVAGEVLVQPVAASRTHRMPARIRTRIFFIMIFQIFLRKFLCLLE